MKGKTSQKTPQLVHRTEKPWRIEDIAGTLTEEEKKILLSGDGFV
jgi:hypothetical protein